MLHLQRIRVSTDNIATLVLAPVAEIKAKGNLFWVNSRHRGKT
jgi:hypothetical protein